MVLLKVKLLKDFLPKITGLLASQKAYPVMFSTRFGIHTFGLKFNIDVLVLDKNKKVVDLSENLAPNRIFIWNPMHNKIIELPEGSIKKYKIKKGIRIQIKSI